jgi:uncharacterized damage-inducible protein DinB
MDMSMTNVIANRLREVLLNGHWVANTNFKEQLADISREQALQKVSGFNSIAALTFHINYYLAGLIQVLEGGALEISDKYSFDLPPIHTDADWELLRSTLFKNAESFASYIDQMDDSQLDQPFVEKKYGTWSRNIEGVIEHCYYHLGQVVLIKKAIVSGS